MSKHASTRYSPLGVATGLFIAGLGGAAATISFTDYHLGSLSRLGTGFLPLVLGVLLFFLGLWQAFTSRPSLSLPGEGLGESLRPLLAVLASLAFFALAVRSFGLFMTAWVTVMICSFGSRRLEWKMAVVAATVLAAGSSFVFIRLLGLSFRMWPQ